jgi:hypothetical protein
MLVIMPFLDESNSFLTTAMAPEYDYDYNYYGDNSYSKYPIEDKNMKYFLHLEY